jgi:O-antigen ligase
LLALLLAGYLFLDRAFAYVHLPGLPLFVGEAVLAVGLLAAARNTSAFVGPVAAEPVLALLAAFMLWGAVRTLPGIPAYGLDAPRDGALWYYGLFALLATAAVTARPELPGHRARQLDRVAPALLLWLCASLLLAPVAPYAPTVPFTDTSVLSHKPGGAAVAALLVLTVLWLLPGDRSRRSRALWSIVALLVIALAGTQNRGGLLGVLAGGAVALLFLEDRARVLARSALVLGLGLGLAVLLAVRIPFAGLQGREYSATQLTTNLVSLTGAETAGNLAGTVDGRHELWTRVLAKQVREDRVLDGTGFGPNLAADVGILDDGEESLRNPHNTHLHVFNRTGALGSLLWVLFWAGWYWRVTAACRRLRRGGRHRDRQVAGVCLATTTAILVSTAFDPLLESPQAAVLTWSLVGIGLVVTRGRP